MSDIGEKRSVLQAFSRAVDRASFALKEYPYQIFQELYNVLQWQAEEDERLKMELKTKRNQFRRPWLHLLSQPSQSAMLLRTIKGHTDCVSSCTFSPDTKRILTGSSDKTLKLILMSDIQIIFILAHIHQMVGK